MILVATSEPDTPFDASALPWLDWIHQLYVVTQLLTPGETEVDAEVIQWAEDAEIPVQVCVPDFEINGSRAVYVRDCSMVDVAGVEGVTIGLSSSEVKIGSTVLYALSISQAVYRYRFDVAEMYVYNGQRFIKQLP